jgi:hypothetical protein
VAPVTIAVPAGGGCWAEVVIANNVVNVNNDVNDYIGR